MRWHKWRWKLSADVVTGPLTLPSDPMTCGKMSGSADGGSMYTTDESTIEWYILRLFNKMRQVNVCSPRSNRTRGRPLRNISKA